MVFYREKGNERPPLSLILPHLYLGAETDVTQDCLTTRGISYVLSVSRCCPQPTFLPCSQYLRIPIDDSLRDDLLPWIPEALRFIDGAMSSGSSVLVHCAAGISRSPALAVAYIMYHQGMDLDHAYRFVKERRPTISPNFNFLGQLQQFQGTLTQKTTNSNSPIQPINSLGTCLPSANENISHSSTVPLSANQSTIQDNSFVTKDFSEVDEVCSDNSNYSTGSVEQRYSYSGEIVTPAQSENSQDQRSTSQLTLSLSSKLRTLTLTLNQNHNETPCKATTPNTNEPSKSMLKPTQLQIPSGFASLSEKRKSLTLSLSPVGAITRSHHQGASKSNNSNSAIHQLMHISSSNSVHRRETAAISGTKRHCRKPSAGVKSSSQSDKQKREESMSHNKTDGPNCSPSQTQAKGEKDGRTPGKGEPIRLKSVEKGRLNQAPKPEKDHSSGKAEGETGSQCSYIESQRNIVVHQQVEPDTKIAASAVEAEEEGLLSPLNLTVNKLLGWGERMLLGVLLGPRFKVGQAALPYRC